MTAQGAVDDASAGAVVGAGRPVVLLRYRAGVVGETARIVHVVPLPTEERARPIGALCGAALLLHDMETVTLGEGMPYTVCLITHVTSTTPTGKPPTYGPDDLGVADRSPGYDPRQRSPWGSRL